MRLLYRNTQVGIGLIEALLALLFLSIGALGFAALQLQAMKTASDANHRARAMMLAQDAVERFQANRSELAGYLTANGWNSPGDPDPTCAAEDPCTAAAIRRNDQLELLRAAETSLPGGQIMARTCEFNGMACVVVSWNDQDISGCMSEAGINTAEDSACLVMEFAR